MKKKYLSMYKRWMKNGMPEPGLCSIFNNEMKGKDELFQLMKPTCENQEELELHSLSTVYWASESNGWEQYKFTPLRQTIVLLMAAMNNEL